MPLLSRRPPLASWLFLGAMGAIVAAVLTSTLVIDSFVRDEARQQATRFLQTNADALRDALDRGMAQHYEEVQVIAQLDQVARSGDMPAVRRTLEQVRASFPQFAWIGLTDNQGVVVAAVDGLLQGVNVSARPWYAGARNAGFVGDVHRAVLLEKLLPAQPEPWRFVDIAAPVRGADGELRGVLGVHLSWTWAAQIKLELVDQVIEQHQAEALVLSADGTVLLGSAALQGKKLEPSAGTLSVSSKTRGAGRYPGLGWQVVLRQPDAVAMGPFHALQKRTLLAAGALCLLLAPLLWLLSRRLAAPMRELAAGLDTDSTASAARNPLYREAALLGDALTRFAQRQRDDAARLRELNATLEERVAQRTAALASSEHRLRDITDNVPALIAYFGADEVCQFANATAMAVHEVSPERLHNLTLREALGERYDEHRPYIAHALAGQRSAYEGEVQIRGKEIAFQTHYVPDRDADGRVAGIYVLASDQTALKAAERRSAAGERRLRTIADNLPVLIAYVDKDERYQFCNATFKSWMGVDPQAVGGRSVSEMLSPEDYAPRKPLLARALAGERTEFEMVTTTAGVSRHLHTTYLPDVSEGGAVRGIYALAVDITAMKTAEEQLLRMARTDTLTGLPNRLRFNEKLSDALARSRRQQQPLALLFLDIDKFKLINDTLGHAGGDSVLKLFAQRVSACVRETDTVARLAGDEFVVILEDLHTPAEPQFIARKIIAAINRSFELPEGLWDVSTSIGIAYHPDGHVPPSTLLAAADRALYEAKAGGRNTFRLSAP
ncbi:MAG TPA: diguanylate cyclase [Rhizobacter sp.]|nr:diguanylate cyclase [Rhizobacter sp.]